MKPATAKGAGGRGEALRKEGNKWTMVVCDVMNRIQSYSKEIAQAMNSFLVEGAPDLGLVV